MLYGSMAIYGSQAEASRGIPEQWRSFLRKHPGMDSDLQLYGASPCTDDHKIHYLAGATGGSAAEVPNSQALTLEAGEYAVVVVDDAARLRETWGWLLGSWLASSGRRERNAPEFERFAGIAEDGTPVGPVEIWIPLEPIAADE